jgi:hypothetical protein
VEATLGLHPLLGGIQRQVQRIGALRAKEMVAADVVRIENGVLAEHWDVIQDEASKADSKSGLPMFGDRFPHDANR